MDENRLDILRAMGSYYLWLTTLPSFTAQPVFMAYTAPNLISCASTELSSGELDVESNDPLGGTSGSISTITENPTQKDSDTNGNSPRSSSSSTTVTGGAADDNTDTFSFLEPHDDEYNKSPTSLIGSTNTKSKSAPTTTTTTRLHCTKCTKTFKYPATLERHLRGHATSTSTEQQRRFACTDCPKTFRLRHHLTEHIRLHTGEQPHVCQSCGKRFSHSGTYSYHRRFKCFDN